MPLINKKQRRFMVDEKEIDIAKLDWDILIILDACRYDKYKEVYREILGELGVLKKGISPATHTLEFLYKTFHDKYLDDVIYISANPFVNSKGIIPFRHGYKFDATKHFRKVIDAWEIEWSNELGTVHPRDMTNLSMVQMDLNPTKRFILHYMQPHAPYIYYGGLANNVFFEEIQKSKRSLVNDLISYGGKFANYFVSHETIWRVGKIFGIRTAWRLGKLWEKYGREGIIKGYVEDLKLVLKFVKVIIDKYKNKNILIISDHGERLGEKGNYGHAGKRVKELIEVPFHKVDRDERSTL